MLNLRRLAHCATSPRNGSLALLDGALARFEGGAGSGGWTVAARQPAIPDPDAGGVVDILARAASGPFSPHCVSKV